jgi:predicted SAM-dependent methyltransferase/ADP-heptose:LPS heptosyltransferase
MTWKATDPQCNEAAKIKWECVQYTRGRGLDIGCSIQKLYPHWIGVDNRKDAALFNHPINPDIYVDTAERMEFFASNSLDFCFSSHLLEHIEPDRVTGCLREWMRIIKPKGYLTLYLPDEDEYPKVGTEHANPDHKWDVNYDKVIQYMRGAGSWDLIDFQKRNQDKEYSLYFVFKKTGSGQFESWKKKEKPKKTCGLVRYGAFGDLLQASSVFAGLKAQGYHVTLYTSPPGDEVVRHDPNIDAFYLQDKDQVPNHLLGDYWNYHKQKYDKWVNLSESVEGTLLAIPGRTLHNWSPAARHGMANRNYLELQHEIAGIPHKPQVKFFPTEEEKTWAKKQRNRMGRIVIGWPVAGSSVHKTNGYLDNVIASVMLDFPEVEIVLMGNDGGKILEQGWEKEPRVHRRCGQWAIRQSIAFMGEVQMAIGPETGLMNAASQYDYPKVVFLSHSSHENLTRDWTNVYPIWSQHTVCPGRGNNEAPACHQLHYNWDTCKKTVNALAQCQEDITFDEVYKPVWHILTDLMRQQVAA